jgi:hypothetical protein
VAAPPPLNGGVALRAVHGDWGVNSGRYIRDLRAFGAQSEDWELELDAPAGAVTLSWPNLRALPADMDLTLTDLTTGQSRLLRSTAAYTFKHGGGTRPLRLTAQRRSGAGLALSSVTATPSRGGGLEIGYTLTAGAQVNVIVSGLSGRALTTLATTAAPMGRSTQTWDGRDAAGRPVPNGIYRIDILATAPDGALVRETRTVRVAR